MQIGKLDSSDGTGPMLLKSVDEPLSTEAASGTSEATLHERLSLFSQISLIRTLFATMVAQSTPAAMDGKAFSLKRIAHHEDTQGQMAAMDAVLALLVRNAEVLAGMAHIQPHQATVFQNTITSEEVLEKDFTRLSAIANPRRRKPNVKGEMVVENEVKGQKRKVQEDGEGKKKIQGEEGQKRKIREVDEHKISVQKEMDREKVKSERERIKSDKKNAKNAKESAKGGEDLMQKDGYTLLEPGLNLWSLLKDTNRDDVWADIFPSIK